MTELDADIVVIGSGAAGLSAALAARDHGADVLVIEKSDRFGGTTAVSGGVSWIPDNDCMAEWGKTDSVDKAMTYLRRLSLGRLNEELARLYVEEAPQVIRYIEANSDLRFKAINVLDYHEEFEGGTVRRSICPELYPAGELGELRPYLRASGHVPVPIAPADLEGGVDLMNPELMGDRLQKDLVGMGAALIAGLLKALDDRGVRLQHSTAARRLVRENSRIVGVYVEHEGRPVRINARRAVILAAGGFEWNEDLKNQFLRGPLEVSCTPPWNTGDGLLMAMDVGASLGNMGEAWWQPAIRIPGEEYDDQPLYRMCSPERALPGSIMVNRKGQRFANEAVNYNDIGRAWHTFDPQGFDFPNLPAWMITHQGFHDKYPFGTRYPGDPMPGWLAQAPTLRELAEKIEVDPDGLEATVARFNQHAEAGNDPDFNRGATAKERSVGDRSRPGANAVLGPLDQGPFYACRVYCGTIGTKGGARINGNGQVLDTRGEPMPGLYAAGNNSASIFGMAYPGGGGTIGPALTFGHLAGRDAATRN